MSVVGGQHAVRLLRPGRRDSLDEPCRMGGAAGHARVDTLEERGALPNEPA